MGHVQKLCNKLPEGIIWYNPILFPLFTIVNPLNKPLKKKELRITRENYELPEGNPLMILEIYRFLGFVEPTYFSTTW